MARRAALYVRTSTDKQTTDNQVLALQEAAKRHGWEVVVVFDDNGVSGSKGRDGRPAFDRMLKAVARKEFDILMAWSVDRLGRSLQDLVATLNELQAKKVHLYLDRQGIDTTTPAGKDLFQMLGVFAEFERSIIKERVLAGLARARANGKRLGRPRVNARTEAAVLRALREGASQRQAAAKCGVALGTVSKIKAAAEAEAA